jgi:hypothetical protein
VAGPAVVPVDPAVDRGTNPVHKRDPAVRAVPCTPRVPNPAALREPADGLDSAPHGLVLGPALDLAHPGREPVVPAV